MGSMRRRRWWKRLPPPASRCWRSPTTTPLTGAEEAVQAGTALGLTVLRGVELGAAEDRHMHILGLHLGPECPALTALCRKLRASRDERKFRIVDFLREKGMDVSLEEVEALAGGGVVARPHFAQVMLRRGVCHLPPGSIRPLSGFR